MKVRQPTPLAHGANAGTDERKYMSTSDELASLLDALRWHRQSCWVTDQVNLTGDLDESPTAAFDQLAGWVEAGVTDILDVRIEAKGDRFGHERFVATHAPHITYWWLGTDDDGYGQTDEWFEAGTRIAAGVLADPDRRLVVHCHMGINRAPSLTFATLLSLGWDPIGALDTIRATRPIAKVLYADDAISWWLRRNGASSTEVATGIAAVNQWHFDNPFHPGEAITRIRSGGFTSQGG